MRTAIHISKVVERSASRRKTKSNILNPVFSFLLSAESWETEPLFIFLSSEYSELKKPSSVSFSIKSCLGHTKQRFFSCLLNSSKQAWFSGLPGLHA